MKRHLNFDSFIIPAYIKLLYVIGSIVILVAGIGLGAWLSGWRGATAGIGISVLMVVFFRMQLEFIMVVFKIYERLDRGDG